MPANMLVKPVGHARERAVGCIGRGIPRSSGVAHVVDLV